MIYLKELLHTIGEEKKSGLIPIDSWRWPDVDHLGNMGFDFDNDYYMRTNKPPEMKVSKKSEPDPTTNKKSDFYFLEETGKPLKKFHDFNDLIEYFDTYEQPEIDKNS